MPFPYTHPPVEQFRPALVIAKYAYPDTPTFLWVLMITSATHRRWPDDIEIADFAAAGLSIPSIVRTAKIATVEAAASQVIGRLPAAQQQTITRLFADRLAAMTTSAAAIGSVVVAFNPVIR